MKKIGLTLGKYAPLHNGHCYLFEKALSEVDALIVLIYQTSVIETPLQIRARWIKELYPKIKVIACWDGPDGYSKERAFEIEQENYIIKMLNGVKVTHFYSSEFYGEHVSKALGAIDRRVDEQRKNVKISATKIRSDLYVYRHFIPANVYRDLIIKVVFVGAMSTGKSTLTESLAKHFETVYASEYGREYWTEHEVNRRIRLEEFDIIAKKHLEREESAVLEAKKYLFVDTNAITTYLYSLDYHGKAPAYVTQKALENAQRYDLFFLCDDDIPYDDTWDRSGPQKRESFQRQIISDLAERRIPYIVLKGSLENRITQVEKILARYKRYNNFFGNRI